MLALCAMRMAYFFPGSLLLVWEELGLSVQIWYEMDVQMVERRGRFIQMPQSNMDHIKKQKRILAKAVTIFPRGWQ